MFCYCLLFVPASTNLCLFLKFLKNILVFSFTIKKVTFLQKQKIFKKLKCQCLLFFKFILLSFRRPANLFDTFPMGYGQVSHQTESTQHSWYYQQTGIFSNSILHHQQIYRTSRHRIFLWNPSRQVPWMFFLNLFKKCIILLSMASTLLPRTLITWQQISDVKCYRY